MAEVGTRKVFENDQIIVWELELEPNQILPLHTIGHKLRKSEKSQEKKQIVSNS